MVLSFDIKLDFFLIESGPVLILRVRPIESSPRMVMRGPYDLCDPLLRHRLSLFHMWKRCLAGQIR